jgi:hypothetical protein
MREIRREATAERGCGQESNPDRAEGKKVLDIFLYGNVLLVRGKSGDNFGCV